LLSLLRFEHVDKSSRSRTSKKREPVGSLPIPSETVLGQADLSQAKRNI
jgi:hypothetical protein